MEPAPTQDNRQIAVSSHLGKDKLLFHRMTGMEELGRLFQFELDLLSDEPDLALDDVVGHPLSVRLDLLDDRKRYFHGFVSRFSRAGDHAGLARYTATLRPWLWFLTRTADCRIFQELSVPDIVKQVFGDHGFTDYDLQLSSTYEKLSYCVQYRETDFNFVSRLLEQEGIYYYFKHEEKKHVLVLADALGAHASIPEGKAIYRPLGTGAGGPEHLNDWYCSHELQTGNYVLSDFDFEKPKADLKANSVLQRKHPNAKLEVFDYPGEYREKARGTELAKRRIEELAAQFERVDAAGNVRSLAVGSLFTLDEHPRDDQNREYLLIAVHYDLQGAPYDPGEEGGGEPFSCSFTAIPSDQPFRTPRLTPKPIVQGPQTAVVVGKSGEEIWTDKYGRVKVQFHWDRYGKLDENSSCWIRVAQIWAGKKWGAIELPRLGHEVIVEFLEGDPDRPIVTGRVYNADCMPPHELPENQTRSGIKTRSTKGGDDKTFNELRFEDKLGEEQIYFHAEKDFERVVENNDTLKIGLEKKDAGDQTIEIHNNRSVKLHEGDDKLDLLKGSRTVTIDKGDLTMAVKAGKGTLTAAKSIELKVGSSSIKIEPAKITIKSPQIAVEGDAKVDVKSPMTTAAGDGVLTLKGGLVKIN